MSFRFSPDYYYSLSFIHIPTMSRTAIPQRITTEMGFALCTTLVGSRRGVGCSRWKWSVGRRRPQIPTLSLAERHFEPGVHAITRHMQVVNNNRPNNNNNIIIIIIIPMTMFIGLVLSSWPQGHCESSLGSFDECRTAPSSRRPTDQATWLGLWVRL